MIRRVGVAIGLLLAGAGWADADPATRPECGGTSIELLTAKENPSLGDGTLVVIARGPIAPPLLEELNRLGDEIRAHERLILDLDSPGGELSYAESVAAFLQSIRADVDLTTYVRHGSRCLSSCVLVFLQGEERIAGGASAWVFHGVCHAFADLPLPQETKRFISLMAEAGVSQEFLSLLESHITAPGEFWVSGYELHSVYGAGIINELLNPWRPMNPIFNRPQIVQ